MIFKAIANIQFIGGILFLLFSRHPGVSAVEFTYGIHTDETCAIAKQGGGGTPGPWTFDTAQCNTWTSSIPNSLKVKSCSSTCICFEQSANSDSCAQAGNVKESCTNKCMQDDQGTWLQISGFSGCGDLQVSDSEYSCGCTKMSPNDACTTASSSGGNPSPTSAPAPGSPTPDSPTPTGSKPTGSKPTGSKPTGSKPTGSKPTGSHGTRCGVSTLLFTLSLAFAVTVV